MKTSGHLTNNGGIRGHSAGEFYPFRVIAVGKLDSIKWHVVYPDGSKSLTAHELASEAFTLARNLHSIWGA